MATVTDLPCARCRCGETIYAQGSADDYPYDPKAKASEARGLDLLRAMEDRCTAQVQFEMYWILDHRSKCRLEVRWTNR